MNSPIKLKDGFKNQIQYVIPQSILNGVKGHPLLAPLMITDIGWYPQAQYHFRERDEGAAEYVLILCEDGVGWCRIGQQYRWIEKNAILLIPKQCAHSYGASEEIPWTIHWVHFVGISGEYFAHQLQKDTYTLPVDTQTGLQVIRLFEDSYQALAEGFSERRLIYCAQVLHHILGSVFFGNQYFLPEMQARRFHSIETTQQFF